MSNITPVEQIENKIFLIRGQKVMLGSDLATLYGVSAKRLNEQVKRNIERFPADFMFQMDDKEYAALRSHIAAQYLRSQFATIKNHRGKHAKYLPYAFTEQGVAMLSSVLRSKRAIQVNIAIMRTFTRLRKMLADNRDLREKIERMERKYDGQFSVIFAYIAEIIDISKREIKNVGFLRKA